MKTTITWLTLLTLIVLGVPAQAAEPSYVDLPQATVNSCAQVTITWRTAEPSKATISYWKSGAAGEVFTASEPEYVTNHSVVLSFALHQFSDVWRYQVVPKNSQGEQPGFNTVAQFTLTRCNDVTSVPAVISDVQVALPTCQEAAVIWRTDKRATSTVTVTNIITKQSTTLVDNYKTTYHSVAFNRPHDPFASRYTFTLRSQGDDGASASWPTSGTRSFTLPACEPDVGFVDFKIINQSCQDLDFGWKTSVPVLGVVKIWRLADPAAVIESTLSPADTKSVVRLHTAARSAPEEYGMEVITTNAAGKTTRHRPLDGKIRMYACVPK